MRFALIDAEKADFPVRTMCRRRPGLIWLGMREGPDPPALGGQGLEIRDLRGCHRPSPQSSAAQEIVPRNRGLFPVAGRSSP